MAKLPTQPVLGLVDGLRVLEALAVRAEPVGSNMLAKELGIEQTKVNRLIKTLAFYGYAHQLSNRKYVAGQAMHILAAQSMHSSALIRHSISHLMALTNFGYIVAMGVLWMDKVSYLYHWDPEISPVEGIGRVALFPATQSSIGLALLAKKTDEQIDEILSGKSIPGFKSKKLLDQKIDKIRELGYAETVFDEKRSIAVTIGEPAFSAVAFAGHFEQVKVEELVGIISRTAKNIEAVISIKK